MITINKGIVVRVIFPKQSQLCKFFVRFFANPITAFNSLSISSVTNLLPSSLLGRANTVVQRRDISSTVLKIMPSLSRPLQHGVKHIAQLYHDFMLDFQHSFNCFHESAFDSFTLCILHQLLFLATHFHFLFLLISLRLFTMGGNVRATTLCDMQELFPTGIHSP